MAAAESFRAPRAGDIAIAAATGAVAISALLLIRTILADLPGPVPAIPAVGTSGWWLVIAVILVQSVLLSWAPRAPRTAAVSISAAVLLLALTAPGPVLDIAALAVPVAVFLASRSVALRAVWPALTVAAILFFTGSTLNGAVGEGQELLEAFVESAVQTAGLFGVPLILAMMLRAQRESRDAQRRELDALRRERDALVEATVARERTAMARELHDIAAHHLSGIALMAAAMDKQVSGDPAAARDSARHIRAESTAVLQNLRRVVGLLRDDSAGQRSVETFASVPDLVERMGVDPGVDVRLRIIRSEDGMTIGAGVGPLAQLAAYRMIQESLANATLHAPGAACVVEIDDTAATEVEVVVRNAPSAAPTQPSHGGFGLVGMRERADLVGAELRYGPTPEGGWEVRLSIPREVAAVDDEREERSG